MPWPHETVQPLVRCFSFVSCMDPEIFIRGPGAESSDRYFRCVCVCVGGGGCQYMESIHVATVTCDFPGGWAVPIHLSLHYLPMFAV